MPDGLEEMFDEAMSDSSSDGSEDVVIDNPDVGTDDLETEPQADLEEFSEDADTEDVTGNEDDVADDVEPPAAEDDDSSWFDEILDKYGDRTVKLKVDGEIVEKPLRELPNMAMMREDYSRKTEQVSRVAKAAQWAQDVQESFNRDPQGTIRAFAEAYGVEAAQAMVDAQASTEDPYEDFDPDVAAMMRKMDEQTARYEAELQRVKSQSDQIAHQRMVEEVRSEMTGLKEQYGDLLDERELLGYAQHFNLPLHAAAEAVVGRKILEQNRTKDEVGAKVAAKTQADRKAKKRQAASTTTKTFEAGSVPSDDFSDVGELFEIMLNSTSQ